jgi:hypothetical protein
MVTAWYCSQRGQKQSSLMFCLHTRPGMRTNASRKSNILWEGPQEGGHRLCIVLPPLSELLTAQPVYLGAAPTLFHNELCT